MAAFTSAVEHRPADRALSVIPAVKVALAAQPGRPMDAATNATMESRFGHDFSRIRIHADADAARAAAEIGARAFTMGNEIGFAAGAYAPHEVAGRDLLSHELTHAVQQRADRASRVELAAETTDPVKALQGDLQALIEESRGPKMFDDVQPTTGSQPRPDLTGIGKLSALKRFVTTMRSIQREWPALDPNTRLTKIGDAASVELKLADVPPFESVNKTELIEAARFTSSQWSFDINEELIDAETLPHPDAAELSDTTLHEARHAEQDFLAARYSAGILGLNAARVATEHQIPSSIADQAVLQKFVDKDDPAAKLGKEMLEAGVLEWEANQLTTEKLKVAVKRLNRLRDKAESALEELANPTPAAIRKAQRARNALRRQIQRVQNRYSKYRKIPAEADAYEVGGAAEEEFLTLPPP